MFTSFDEFYFHGKKILNEKKLITLYVHTTNTNNFFTVTLPPGVVAGQEIHVQAPDGKINAIIVPAGFGPGSKFTVEFAPDAVAPPSASTDNSMKYNSNNSNYQYAPPPTSSTSTQPPPPTVSAQLYDSNNNYNGATAPVSTSYTPEAQPIRPDDGFASGFARR